MTSTGVAIPWDVAAHIPPARKYRASREPPRIERGEEEERDEDRVVEKDDDDDAPNLRGHSSTRDGEREEAVGMRGRNERVVVERKPIALTWVVSDTTITRNEKSFM
jgi:hypothetical protein